MHLKLPVRFTGPTEDIQKHTTLTLEVATTALLLVDCEDVNIPGSPVDQVIKQTLRPTLAAIRSIGLKPIFLYGGDHHDPCSIEVELHGTRRGKSRALRPWPLPMPQWVPGVAPLAGDPVIVKCGQNGFRETSLDFYLRTSGIETLLCVGFSFKSCLFYTMVGAAEHNYRVIFLRDGTHPPGQNEFPDTLNDALPEKGWVRLVLTRLIEDHWGYSSTCEALIAACREAK